MDEINSIWHKIAIDKAERIASYKADPQKAIEQIEWGEYECEGGTIETDLAWVAIKELLAEPSDADVAEAIDYFEDVIPYMAECDGEKHYKTALDCMRQHQKPSDEAVRLCSTCIGCECEPELGETVKNCKAYVKREPTDIADAIEAMTDNPLYNADIRKTIQTALRQMRSEPCEWCQRWAFRSDHVYRFCPDCGRKLVK